MEQPTISQNLLHRRVNAMVGAPSSSHIIDMPENSTELVEIEEQPNNQEPAEPDTENTETSARVANKEHAKRLTTYTKTALLVTVGLFGSFYTNLDTHENKFFIMAVYTSLLFAFILELLLLGLIDCIKKPKPDCLCCRYVEQMHIFIYISNILLMFSTMFLLLLCTLKYAFLAVFFLLALLVDSSLLYHGRSKHTASIREYEQHDSELNHFSELSSGLVIMLFSGLSSFVFASPTLSLQKNEIKVTECFLFIIIIMSLLLMLLTTVPPAAQFLSTRKRMVGVVKYLFYALVTLLSLVGLIAVSEVLKGIVVFSTLAHIIGAMYWFIKELMDEHEDLINEDTVPVPEEVDSLTMVVAAAAFFALMFVYFQNVDSIKHYSWHSYLLLAICMISLCSTFMSLLTKIIIFIYALETRAWAKAETILNFITIISLIVAFVSTILNELYGSHTSKGSSN